VAAFEVVVAEIGIEVALQGRELWHQRSGEGRSPAFLEDGPLHPFNAAIGLRPAGPNEPVCGAPTTHRLAERRPHK